MSDGEDSRQAAWLVADKPSIAPSENLLEDRSKGSARERGYSSVDHCRDAEQGYLRSVRKDERRFKQGGGCPWKEWAALA